MNQAGVKAKQKGFTIVELLIVIVVIGILAAITIVAYNGIQSRAKDARLQAALANKMKAVAAEEVDTQKPPFYDEIRGLCPSSGACPDAGIILLNYFQSTAIEACDGIDYLGTTVGAVNLPGFTDAGELLWAVGYKCGTKIFYIGDKSYAPVTNRREATKALSS